MSYFPFRFVRIEIGPTWIPDTEQEYLVEHAWSDDKKSAYVIGQFRRSRKGLYNFHWVWSASSFQLSIDSAKCVNPDWKRFRNIWKFIREPSRMEGFITDEDFKL